ncbi:hypothetical protein D3C79_707190 [compost metagenome]
MQHQRFDLGLGHDQPTAQPGDLHQCQQTGQRDQQAEQAPGVSNPVSTAGVKRAAQHQPRQISGQHHGEGKCTSAHELYD